MKVLGVGWAKTGTTSLGECLKILGYRHKTQDFGLVDDLGTEREENIYRVAEGYDSFEDWPWILLYEEFDARFPGSKFILTVRDPRSWIVSYRKQLDRAGMSPEMDEWRTKLYGLPFPDVSDAALLERYERHNRDVRAYFADRPDDLLEVDWSTGDGWQELCAFLGRPVPRIAFPHANMAPDRSLKGRIARKFKAGIRTFLPGAQLAARR